MPVRLPQELIDWVIDHLHNDHHTLCACSLVCRDWLHSSRYHKFWSITLRSRGDGTRSFETCPLAVEFVRELTISHSRGRTNWTHLEKCVNLHRLSLHSINFYPTPSIFPHAVKHLKLDSCFILRSQDFALFLCKISPLDSLTISGTIWSTAQGSTGLESVQDQISNSAPFSGHIELDGGYSHRVIDVLLSFPNGIQFRSVDMEMWNGHADSLNMLLIACGSSLSALRLRVLVQGPEDGRIDLGHNDNLCELSWQSYYFQMWSIDILSTITSPFLHTISLTFGYNREAFGKFDWDRFDILLSGPQFRGLTRLTITYHTANTPECFIESKEQLKGIVRLPRLRVRGDILRLELIFW